MSSCTADIHNGALSQEFFRQLAHNEKMAELGRISSGIVHELNAPLSVITSAAQMILRESEVPESIREMVERIGAEAQRLSQLTRGLLSFSSHDETSQECDANLTITFVLDFIGFEAAQRGVTITREPDHQLPLIQIGGNTLKQVLLNIVMNALQAMEEKGGALTVKTYGDPDGRIWIDIMDNGPGIAEEILGKIFEPYFTTKKADLGTGLGLFVTKSLIEQAGGSIEVSSTPGAGTRFRLGVLPVRAD